MDFSNPFFCTYRVKNTRKKSRNKKGIVKWNAFLQFKK